MSKRLLASAALLAGLLAPIVPGLRADGKVCPAPDRPKLIQKHYLVADLLTPITDPTARSIEPTKPTSYPFWECRTRTTADGAHVPTSQQLVDLIVRTVAPESWSSKGGRGTIDYFPLGMTLVINQTPDVQEQVAELLAALRRSQEQEVALELRILKVDDACVEQLRRIPKGLLAGLIAGSESDWPKVAFLNHDQVYSLLETLQGSQRTNVTQAPKLTLFNGQEAAFRWLERQFYVTKVRAVASGRGGFVFVPSNEPYETGINLSLQPIISGDQRFVRLHVKGTLTDLMTDPVPLAPVESQLRPVQEDGSAAEPMTFTQYLQVPRFDTVTVDKTLCIPDGNTALLYGWKCERQSREENCLPLWSELPFIGELFKNNRDVHYTEHVMLLVTPHVIVPKEEEVLQTGVISNPALVQDDPPSPCRTAEMPPAPGGVETSESIPVPPPPPSAEKPKPDVSKKVAKLLKKYEKACKKGDLVRAKKYGHKALSLDPTCFSPSRKKLLLNEAEDSRKIQNEWTRPWSTNQPVTYDHIRGSIE